MPVAKRDLTNVEYLCLKMQANPGKSGRFYRRALGNYHGDWHKGTSENFNNYFLPPRAKFGRPRLDDYQVGRYYVDTAPRTKHTGGLGTATSSLVPVKGQWHLTVAGWAKANQARVKLGLPTITPTAPLPK